METNPGGNPRRKFLGMAVSSILMENSFESADKECLETLSEMLQSFIYELGQSAKNYCELSGRTQPILGDVIISLVNMGFSVHGLENYAKRESRQILPVPQQALAQKQLSILQAGQKNPHPSHIPNHLPPLPDPHAYIRTPTYKQPVTEYEAIREKAANQKRDIEKALTKFLAKTSDIHSLFDIEDNQMFPLIACKPSFPPYLTALNPTDQVFDFEELEYYYQVANRKEDISDSKEGDDNEDDDGDEIKKEKDIEIKVEETTPTKTEQNSTANSTAQINTLNNSPSIDNPYLRAATIPRKVKHETSMY